MTVELWNTERIRQELGAKSIRSAMTIIMRLGLTPVARETGRGGMNLYDAAAAGPIIAAHKAKARRVAPGADLGQTGVGTSPDVAVSGRPESGDDQPERPDVSGTVRT